MNHAADDFQTALAEKMKLVAAAKHRGAKPLPGGVMPTRVVCLSLDNRPDRWAAFTESLQQSSILRTLPVERWRARPPSEFIIPDWWNRVPSVFATGRDHLDIIESSYVAGHQHVLIFEDDAIIQPCFDAAYRAATAALPADWMGLWLSSDGHQRRPVAVAPGLVRSTGQAMLHAYLLNRAGMKKVWEYTAARPMQVIDAATEDMHQWIPHFYATAENAVRQFGDRFIGQRTNFYDGLNQPAASDGTIAEKRRAACLACGHSKDVSAVGAICKKVNGGTCARSVMPFHTAKVDRCPLKLWPA